MKTNWEAESFKAAIENLSSCIGEDSTFKVTMDCYGDEKHTIDIKGGKKLKGFKSHPEAGSMHFELRITQKKK